MAERQALVGRQQCGAGRPTPALAGVRIHWPLAQPWPHPGQEGPSLLAHAQASVCWGQAPGSGPSPPCIWDPGHAQSPPWPFPIPHPGVIDTGPGRPSFSGLLLLCPTPPTPPGLHPPTQGTLQAALLGCLQMGWGEVLSPGWIRDPIVWVCHFSLPAPHSGACAEPGWVLAGPASDPGVNGHCPSHTQGLEWGTTVICGHGLFAA